MDGLVPGALQCLSVAYVEMMTVYKNIVEIFEQRIKSYFLFLRVGIIRNIIDQFCYLHARGTPPVWPEDVEVSVEDRRYTVLYVMPSLLFLSDGVGADVMLCKKSKSNDEGEDEDFTVLSPSVVKYLPKKHSLVLLIQVEIGSLMTMVKKSMNPETGKVDFIVTKEEMVNV
ncbi:hypothetical protein BDB01DRAFT_831576 [Pilobolus umbonatus]|nr:hypothetical protein BDB01DRAFT_831576 [Pilobolus umbonatus]